MKISPEMMAAVLALPGPKRYAHFVKVSADQNSMWGLDADGWALMETDEGGRVLPVWPAKPYAERFVYGAWAGYVPKEIELNTFFNELLPSLRGSTTLLAVFPTLGEKGVVVDLDVLVSDLRQELSRIE